MNQRFTIYASLVSQGCQMCGIWSTTPSPYPLVGMDMTKWSPLVPWGLGSRCKPCGPNCRICVNVYWLQDLSCLSHVVDLNYCFASLKGPCDWWVGRWDWDIEEGQGSTPEGSCEASVAPYLWLVFLYVTWWLLNWFYLTVFLHWSYLAA